MIVVIIVENKVKKILVLVVKCVMKMLVKWGNKKFKIDDSDDDAAYEIIVVVESDGLVEMLMNMGFVWKNCFDVFDMCGGDV